MAWIRRLGIFGLSLVAVSWLGAGAAMAGSECTVELTDGTSKTGRVLEGEVRTINKKKLIVIKYGDPVQLVPHEHTVVSGKKDSYGRVKKSDYVKLCYHRSMRKDDPRYVWSIEVTDPPDDGAVDVE